MKKTADTYKEDWAFYLCRVNDKAASIFVDLGLRPVAPDLQKPRLLIVWLYLIHPNPETGLTTNAEFEKLKEIEDALVSGVQASGSICYPGRITTDGRREFYFFGETDGGFEDVVSKILQSFEGYKYEAWSQDDSSWNQYVNLLFPGDAQLRWIVDERVIEAMTQKGDKSEIPRPIEHWLYFERLADREDFIAAIQSFGFSLADRMEPDADSHATYGVRLSKAQPADIDAIYATTSLLEEQAKLHRGDYDGWESVVVRANEI